jgi:subtilisin family serine protease
MNHFLWRTTEMSDEKLPMLPEEELTPTFVIAALSEVQDWGISLVDIPDAWKRTKGAGITVAVLDTGGPDHEDLNDNLLPAQNCAGTRDAADHQGHGTHVAGIVAAQLNGIGVVGVAPEAKVLPIKVLDDAGRASFTAVASGIRVAIEQGADVINMSLGSH